MTRISKASTAQVFKLSLIAGTALSLSACAGLSERFNKPPTVVEAERNLPEAPAASPEDLQPGYIETAWAQSAPYERPSTDWVNSFSDPILTALVNEAYNNNPDLGSAQARIDAAEASARIAKADKLPTVSLGARVGRTENANRFIPDRTSFSLGPDVSWDADLWGRINDQAKIGATDVIASNFDYYGARLAVAGRVSNAWLNLIEAQLLLDLSDRDIQTQEQALRLTQRRFNLSGSGASDIRLARSTLANSQAVQALRQQVRANAARQLEVLLRRYPSNEIESARDLPALPPLTGIARPADVLLRRPDLRAAEVRLDAAGLRVDIARKALLPRLTLDGGLNASATSLKDFFDIDALIANVGANLFQPLFQGGRLKADVARNEAVLRAGLEDYASNALNAYREVEDALTAERRLSQRETALRTSLDEATKAEERLARRYSEGLASILQLLDAQSRRLSAESQLISARKERLSNRVGLHLALGGGELANAGTDNIILATQTSAAAQP